MVSDIFDMPGVAMLVDDGVTRGPMGEMNSAVLDGQAIDEREFLVWVSERMDVITRELLAQLSSASPASLTNAPWRDSVTLLPESVVTWA